MVPQIRPPQDVAVSTLDRSMQRRRGWIIATFSPSREAILNGLTGMYVQAICAVALDLTRISLKRPGPC